MYFTPEQLLKRAELVVTVNVLRVDPVSPVEYASFIRLAGGSSYTAPQQKAELEVLEVLRGTARPGQRIRSNFGIEFPCDMTFFQAGRRYLVLLERDRLQSGSWSVVHYGRGMISARDVLNAEPYAREFLKLLGKTPTFVSPQQRFRAAVEVKQVQTLANGMIVGAIVLCGSIPLLGLLLATPMLRSLRRRAAGATQS